MGTIKQDLLQILSDRQPHSALEILQCMGFRYSWDRRLVTLRNVGIVIESKHIEGSHWEYTLITPNDEIDFARCCLKPKEPEIKDKMQKSEQLRIII